jgi:hypothetical protein
MLTNDNNSKIVFYVKSANGTFGPYATRNLAEMAIAMGKIPQTAGGQPIIVERTESGQDILFG